MRKFLTVPNGLRFILFTFVILILVMSWDAFQSMDIEAWLLLPRDWWVSVSLILGLSLIKSVLFFLPIQLIYVAAGIFFPMSIALTLCLVGLTMEITLTYFFGKWMGKATVDNLVSKNDKLGKWFASYKMNEFSGMFWARLAPFSVEAVSLLLGAAGAKYKSYIVASLLGSLPKIGIFILLGSLLGQPRILPQVLIFLVVLSIWIFIVIRLIRKGRIGLRWKPKSSAV
ncbi:TVP38/TMEM64 family protein [Paenibacillus sp. 1P07SE]|uniref:TVP38/TMEM64 family protein n=1 Tax=Paenibacillus sp. 1P07SE TaxID=3132209 RepID=UPI0039A5F8B6